MYQYTVSRVQPNRKAVSVMLSAEASNATLICATVQAGGILDQIRDAEAEVASRGGAARGLLKVGAPSDFGRRHLGPILALFTAQHPGLEAHLVLSDAGLENQADGCDLVLRFGLPNDPGMIARKIAMTTRVLCAAPSYLTNHGTPHSPDDLLRHSCLRLARRHHLDDLWRFKRDSSEFEVRVPGKLSSGDGAVLHQWALDVYDTNHD
jgi:LysR family transcriptional regulator, transcriptional activator for dmlA